jgi:hypothetical protein
VCLLQTLCLLAACTTTPAFQQLAWPMCCRYPTCMKVYQQLLPWLMYRSPNDTMATRDVSSVQSLQGQPQVRQLSRGLSVMWLGQLMWAAGAVL